MLKSATVQVDGVEYRWSVFRQAGWSSTRGQLGMAILVGTMGGGRRELLLEYTIAPDRHGDLPQNQRFNIPHRRLIESIQSAIQAGWDTDSRGKHFVFEAGPVNPGQPGMER